MRIVKKGRPVSGFVCPHCKSTEGYYRYGDISGTATISYTSTGKEIEEDFELDWDFSGDMHIYCSNCDKEVTDEVRRDWDLRYKK